MNIDIEWSGTGVAEVGRDAATGKILVEVDPRYFRPTEVDLLVGDPSKAHQALGWRHTTTLSEMVTEMVESDVKVVQRERERKDRHG